MTPTNAHEFDNLTELNMDFSSKTSFVIAINATTIIMTFNIFLLLLI
jgi:hypothetical protein